MCGPNIRFLRGDPVSVDKEKVVTPPPKWTLFLRFRLGEFPQVCLSTQLADSQNWWIWWAGSELQGVTIGMRQQQDMDSDALYSIFVFKVEPCPQKNKHPWDSCDYCHPQENARRRDVRKHRYVAEPCQDYKLHGLCVLGKECPFAHGVFEINLHPSKYRTQMCTEGLRCCRKKCFFAHSQAQLRQPDYSYGYRSAAEAELEKERLLLAKRQPVMVRTHAPGFHQGTSLRRTSPMQLAPGTPPQAAPQRLMNGDCVGSMVDAFCGLPASQASASPEARSYALFDQMAWTGQQSETPVDLAAAQLLHNRAALQSASLPSDTGPRISMRVRRELGLEPPAKPKHNSAGGYNHGASGLPNVSAMRTYLAGHNAASQVPVTVPPPPIIHHLQHAPAGGGLSQALPGISGQLRIPSPISSTASLKVTAPSGVSMTVEEAMAHLGMSTSPRVCNDLGLVASALDLLSRLGYTLAASEANSPTVSDLGRHSGQSTPQASLGGVPSMSAAFNNAAAASLSPPAAAAAPGLAALGLSSGNGRGYNLFN